jgi:hypothetical protein
LRVGGKADNLLNRWQKEDGKISLWLLHANQGFGADRTDQYLGKINE